MNLLISIALCLVILLLGVFLIESITKKFFTGKLIAVVCNKQTDDGENITLQFMIPENTSSDERLELLNTGMESLEKRMKFTAKRFSDFLDVERAKQAEESGLKSV